MTLSLILLTDLDKIKKDVELFCEVLCQDHRKRDV